MRCCRCAAVPVNANQFRLRATCSIVNPCDSSHDRHVHNTREFYDLSKACSAWLDSSDECDFFGFTGMDAGGRQWSKQLSVPFDGPQSSQAPTIGAVVNGASFAGGGIVPGEIATLFGSNLTSSTGINLTSGLPLLTNFLNVSVIVNGTAAPLFAVDNVNGQQQINFQVPWEVANGPNANIAVTNNGATSSIHLCAGSRRTARHH